MLREILRAAGLAPGVLTTVEYEIGARVIPASRTTPDAPAVQSMLHQMLKAGCRSAVMEVTSHALVQKRAAGVDFDAGVFTNLTHDHLDYHHTMERYFEAKKLLFTGLGCRRKSAHAVVNIDDPWGARLLEHLGPRAAPVTYSAAGLPAAAVRAEGIVLAPVGTRFRARTPWGAAEVNMPLLGRFNVSNALAAIATAGSLGVEPALAARVLAGFRSAPGRLEQIATGRGFQVFVDYAHTDDALQNVLGTLREITAGRLIAVFGCGGNRDREKRPLMGKVVSRLADYAIVTSDNPRNESPTEIIAQIVAGFPPGGAAFETCEDRAEAIARAVRLARPGDAVLVAGKGHEVFQEFANRSLPFDDRQVVRRVLAAEG
jgi:UDP-N-acetylmuramoyl-L-alanyl-D-glutamate--2,6-diaminopimelate ligase